MRTPQAVVPVALLAFALVAACSSGGESSGTTTSGASTSGAGGASSSGTSTGTSSSTSSGAGGASSSSGAGGASTSSSASSSSSSGSPPADVPVTVNGIASLTGQSAIYNGQYVLWQTDFGFLWLDTVALTAGHIQAEGYCVASTPPSNSGLYVIGDCNGISYVYSSAALVEVFQFSGQCSVSTGCGGPSAPFASRLFFQLGSWAYLGDQDYQPGDIVNSTQTTDPQGFTWKVEIVMPADLKHYIWHAG